MSNRPLLLAITSGILAVLLPVSSLAAAPPASLSSELNEAAVKQLWKTLDGIHKAARELDTEANRHAVLEEWNGMFGAGSPAFAFPYQNYSEADMMPVNSALVTDYSQGNLLPPRPELVKTYFAQLSAGMKDLNNQVQSLTLAPTADSKLKVEWETFISNMQSTQTHLNDLDKIINYDVILQQPFIDTSKKVLDDANGLDSICKHLEKLAKHE